MSQSHMNLNQSSNNQNFDNLAALAEGSNFVVRKSKSENQNEQQQLKTSGFASEHGQLKISKGNSNILMSQISVPDSKEEEKDDDSGESKESIQNDSVTIINDYFLTEE